MPKWNWFVQLMYEQWDVNVRSYSFNKAPSSILGIPRG